MQGARALLAAGMVCFLGVVCEAVAGRPLAIDDADPTEPGRFKVEAGASYSGDEGCKHWDFPVGLGYGLVPGIEVSIGFGGQFEERIERLEESGTETCTREHGVGDLVAAAKWKITDSCPLGARHALVPCMKLPTADNDKGLGSGEPDCDLTWIVSRAIGERMGAHLNVGYSWIGGPDADLLHYGVAIDYQLCDSAQWVGEVVAEKELCGGTVTIVRYNTGLRWVPVESLTIDISGGAGMGSVGPDFTATAGLTWAFGRKSTEGK